MTDTERPAPSRGGTFASFRAPHFTAIYLSGWIFNTTRWGLGFLAAFVVNDLTGSPRLVQLTGSFMWGPLLLAGLAGGAISDRFDRKAVLLATFAVLTPATVVIGLLALADELEAWMVMPFMVLVGLAWVVDLTARRALVFDLVGEERISNAMALEMVSSSLGLALGALVGGSVIGALGVGQAYLVVAALIAVAAVLMVTVPSAEGRAATPEPFLASLLEGFRALPANLTLVSILGVTVMADFFHFAYTPIVPVIAEAVGASPFRTGLLAAGTGLGMMIASLWVAYAEPHRGRAYVVGCGVACVAILGFALFDDYWLVLASLLVASLGFGLFAATQAALVMSSTTEEMRGRAMGLLSMAIGALPIGMYLLGEMAEAVGAPAAVTAFNVAGLIALIAWVVRRPEVLSTP